VAAYYPEANALVPLDSTAEKSNQPVYKSIVVRLDRPGDTGRGVSSSHGSSDQGSGSHRDDDPHHLS
jgi:formate dehydrogenase major subunit